MSVFAYSQSDGEIERHAPIVAPPGAPVHAVVGAARDWMAAPRAGGPISISGAVDRGQITRLLPGT